MFSEEQQSIAWSLSSVAPSFRQHRSWNLLECLWPLGIALGSNGRSVGKRWVAILAVAGWTLWAGSSPPTLWACETRGSSVTYSPLYTHPWGPWWTCRDRHIKGGGWLCKTILTCTTKYFRSLKRQLPYNHIIQSAFLRATL